MAFAISSRSTRPKRVCVDGNGVDDVEMLRFVLGRLSGFGAQLGLLVPPRTSFARRTVPAGRPGSEGFVSKGISDVPKTDSQKGEARS